MDVNPSPTSSGSDSSKGKSSSKDKTKSTEIIDHIARRLSVLQTAIDYTKSKFENLFSLKSKQNNLDKQIKQTTTLLNAHAKAAEKYQKKANSIKLSDDLKKSNKKLFNECAKIRKKHRLEACKRMNQANKIRFASKNNNK